LKFVVTGASSGIGRAVANSLASRGHTVFAAARTRNALDALTRDHPGLVDAITTDLSVDSGRQFLISRLKSAGSLDGLIHAAGAAVEPSDYQALNGDAIIDVMKSHVAAPIELNKALINQLRGARILFIDSYSASAPRVGWAGYSIVKAAAQMAARAATEEISDATVIRVFPGAVRTPLISSLLSENQTSKTADAFKSMDREEEFLQWLLRLGIPDARRGLLDRRF